MLSGRAARARHCLSFRVCSPESRPTESGSAGRVRASDRSRTRRDLRLPIDYGRALRLSQRSRISFSRKTRPPMLSGSVSKATHPVRSRICSPERPPISSGNAVILEQFRSFRVCSSRRLPMLAGQADSTSDDLTSRTFKAGRWIRASSSESPHARPQDQAAHGCEFADAVWECGQFFTAAEVQALQVREVFQEAFWDICEDMAPPQV